ncbi:putative tartrate dehydrogenase/decarboxylase TtuC [Purpureocillium lavendulum]|uniref:Tartrate dehydrogenase/decarboxylase TtuC n=1 Tax=Purpureocillium lavendulum TaxID=1247861 RepID=A0AB34FZ50_9HYPO|nr:putative tartrate dehydrogenase/decarboxylase TtuC [Purpureocillium lavendulum]
MSVSNPTVLDGLSRMQLSESQTQEEAQDQLGVLSDTLEDDDDDSVFDDQDGAQAALQPAISSAASHLTSSQTPAVEKAAALERVPGGGFFDGAIAEAEAEDDGQGTPEPVLPVATSSAAQNASLGRPNLTLGRIPTSNRSGAHPLPSPWVSAPRDIVVDGKGGRSSQTRGVLSSAFGPTRQRRSRSAGQEALKKLTKAFPSINMPTHLLPSLPASFFSSFSGDHKPGQANVSRPATHRAPSSAALLQQSKHLEAQRAKPSIEQSAPTRTRTPPPSHPRPPVLRRVTSDDSILYHSLSRASSLGDDERFQDVREMVNIRFMAIRDSLPDVPNFRMPSLPKLNAASRMSSISLNGFFASSSDDTSGPQQATAVRDFAGTAQAPRPNASSPFDRVLEELEGDIVVLGGYRGSVLRSAEPPHQQLWAPVKLGFNLRKANLEVGLEEEDEATMEDRIIPSGMLKHIGPVDISRKLFKRLKSCKNARDGKLRVWDYGYDWRLSPALSARKLRKFLAGLPSNQPGVARESRGAMVIAHSLGGLITRHVVNQQPDLFAGVLYAGVPQRCINILGPFRNGDAVLFNEKLLTAQVNFSIRTSFVLLPDDGFCFVDRESGEAYPVDFFNADDWIKWRLSPCVATPLPPFIRDKQQTASPLSSLFPNSFLKGGRSDKKLDSAEATDANERRPGQGVVEGILGRDRTIAPQLNPEARLGSAAPLPPSPPPSPPAPERERYVAYLRRTLAATKQFRSDLAHLSTHESANAYPPHAVLYGKSIPTVYAAQVSGRAAIPCSDAYDDLLFRAGDGVVLAREAMLPQGYALVRAGRVSTERGHLTMLGDLPAVGRALEALVRGRKKGIGLGTGAATDD